MKTIDPKVYTVFVYLPYVNTQATVYWNDIFNDINTVIQIEKACASYYLLVKWIVGCIVPLLQEVTMYTAIVKCQIRGPILLFGQVDQI